MLCPERRHSHEKTNVKAGEGDFPDIPDGARGHAFTSRSVSLLDEKMEPAAFAGSISFFGGRAQPPSLPHSYLTYVRVVIE
jgi:hypothetical protein